MIRGWFESRYNSIVARVSRRFGKNGIASQLGIGWIEGLYIAILIVLSAGIVNAIIQPVNTGYTIFPSSGGQSAIETVVDAFVLLVGTMGVYLSYLSGRQTTKTRMGNFFLVIGLFLIAVSLYIGYYVLSSK